MENPIDGQYCRKCGCDLRLVPDAISGKLAVSGDDKLAKNKKKTNWAEALTLLSVSIAFFAISIFLAYQPMGAFWWFWLLIPAFATLAQGIGKVIELNQDQKNNINFGSDRNMSLPRSQPANALPPQQTEFAPNTIAPNRQPADRIPPSVVEGTTRNLEMNPEAETTNLPRTDN